MLGLFWYIRGCALLWRCCHGGGTLGEIDALRRGRRAWPKTSAESSAALNSVLIGAWKTVKRRGASPCAVKKGGGLWRRAV